MTQIIDADGNPLDLQRDDKKVIAARLMGSLSLFTRVFYKLRTGREFIISNPPGRESPQISVFKGLTRVAKLKTQRLLINIPPRYGKSEMVIHFIAWVLARYPDSNWIYVSYAQSLAAKHTYTIKEIMEIPLYKELFGVEIRQDSSAKDNFRTNYGGNVVAFGLEGGITGRDAGLPGLDRISGGVVIDDAHKPTEVTSDNTRDTVWKQFLGTVTPRIIKNVALLFIGQRLHEEDLPAHLLNGEDGYDWEKIILHGLDSARNPLDPRIHTKEMLETMERVSPYDFAAQYQQDPQPASGGIFKEEWIRIFEESPECFGGFITVDTAETDKTWNDQTVFSFWGVHKIMHREIDTGLFGIHCIHSVADWWEPKDLQSQFLSFYAACMRNPIVSPHIVAIEKKSTGTTLISVLKEFQGLQILEVERNGKENNKTRRFLDCQPFFAQGQISFPRYAQHTAPFISQIKKISANNTHGKDDMVDTLADAIKIALIDKLIINMHLKSAKPFPVLKVLTNRTASINNIRTRIYG